MDTGRGIRVPPHRKTGPPQSKTRMNGLSRKRAGGVGVEVGVGPATLADLSLRCPEERPEQL